MQLPRHFQRHISQPKNQTSKSNISKTVRDRDTEPMEVIGSLAWAFE